MDISPLENLINSKACLEHHIYLKNAILNKENSTLLLDFYYSETVTEEERKAVYGIIKSNIPPYIKHLEIDIRKLEKSEEAVKTFILKKIKEKYPLIDSCIDKNINIIKTEGSFKVIIKCEMSAVDYIEKTGAVSELTENLKSEFFDNFTIDFKKEKIIELEKLQPGETDFDEETYVQSSNKRLIKVFDIQPLCGSLTGETAFYITDIKTEMSPCVICGKVSNFANRLTKNGKTMLTFDVTDFTGKLRCLFFPAKKFLKKLEELKDGISVLIGGSIKEDNFNGGLCMMASNISLCKLPDKSDFIEQKPAFKKENSQYKTIFPKKVIQTAQSSLFETFKANPYFENKFFVVFDIETTGLYVRENAKITEIGAVKIFNGIIIENFSTLIDPQVPVPEEITKLTGITDEMVKGKPTIDEVIPDFYKFTRNCILVAHYAEFDVEFIKFFGKILNYNFDNHVLDTVKLGRTKIKLSNYKLQTLAEALNVPLKNHHRAVDDALACAEIFLKLNA